MQMIYRFRIILDTHEDVFRDLEIVAEANLEDFHNAITQAFGFEGGEMASFYLTNDQWEQGEEIPLFDLGEGESGQSTMQHFRLSEVTHREQTKLIYVYDFLNMWTFLIELADIAEPEKGMSYPNLMFAHGQLPSEAPQTEFVGEDTDDSDHEEEDLDTDHYDNFDFDEHWN